MNIAESTWKFMICFNVDSAMSVFDDLLFGDENYIHFDSPSNYPQDNQLNLYVSDANNHRIQKFLRY
jgi:hypothetical protein